MRNVYSKHALRVSFSGLVNSGQIVSGDYCALIGDKFGITVAQIEQYNAKVRFILGSSVYLTR